MPRQYRGRIDRVCQQCGAAFTISASELAVRPALYCSRRCLGESRRIGDPFEQRQRVRQRNKARNKAFLAEVNARTVCAHCGAQPVDWHNPEHVELNRQRYRIASMAARCHSIEAIRTEMARCTPLCRRCHMKEDGRLARLAGVIRPELQLRACSECEQVTRRIIQGLCSRCYFKYHPPAPRVHAVSPPKPCLECTRLYKPLRRGLCMNCDARRRYAERSV